MSEPERVGVLLRRVVARFAATASRSAGGWPGTAVSPGVSDEVALRRLTDRLTAEPGGPAGWSAAAVVDAAGPLAAVLTLPGVTDVLVNGDQVWVDQGSGLVPVRVALGGPESTRRLAQRLVALAGRRVDEACPYVDAQLPDGTRLHVVLAPVARGGPYLSLRTFPSRGYTLTELVAAGTVAPNAARLLIRIVASRLPYLVTGGTGSGKTTLLAALLAAVPPDERIVVVEDVAELRPAHPHVVRLQARTANIEGAGHVTLRDLVRQALRMRPDRLVVGECRGAEVVDLLGALNTGHEGGAATLHANGSAEVPARLEALGLLGGVPRQALHAFALAALRIVIHLRRTAEGRVLEEVCLLRARGDTGLMDVAPAWRRAVGAGPAAAELTGLIAARGIASGWRS